MPYTGSDMLNFFKLVVRKLMHAHEYLVHKLMHAQEYLLFFMQCGYRSLNLLLACQTLCDLESVTHARNWNLAHAWMSFKFSQTTWKSQYAPDEVWEKGLVHILFMSHMYDYITGIRVINSFSCVSAGGWTHPERLSEWQSKEGALISLLFLPAQILFVCHLSINLSFCSPLLTAVPILAARRGRLVGQCSSLITRLSTSPTFIALYCKRWNLGHWELEKQATVTQRWPKGDPKVTQRCSSGSK